MSCAPSIKCISSFFQLTLVLLLILTPKVTSGQESSKVPTVSEAFDVVLAQENWRYLHRYVEETPTLPYSPFSKVAGYNFRNAILAEAKSRADAGDPASMNFLGIHSLAFGSQETDWLEKAIAAKYKPAVVNKAVFEVAVKLRTMKQEEKDRFIQDGLSTMFPRLHEMAQDGDGEAHLAIASLAMFVGDTANSKKYFASAARLGIHGAVVLPTYLDVTNQQSPDVASDCARLKGLADEGDAFAAYYLGELIQKDLASETEYGKAEDYFKIASQGNLLNGQIKYARCLLDRTAFASPPITDKAVIAEATNLLRRAVQDTRYLPILSQAKYVYGVCCLQGHEKILFGSKTGPDFIIEAARANYPPAIHHVAELYAYGLGVRPSRKLALDYLEKARRAGQSTEKSLADFRHHWANQGQHASLRAKGEMYDRLRLDAEFDLYQHRVQERRRQAGR